MTARLTTAGLLAAAALLTALAMSPGVAVAQTTCVPGAGDTSVPGAGGEPPPGGVIVGPGESCPETEPVAETPPTDLPPPPKCNPCPKKHRSVAKSGSIGGSTPVSYTGSPEQLPFTGLDAITWALLLGGIGLVAIGAGFGLRRRILRPR